MLMKLLGFSLFPAASIILEEEARAAPFLVREGFFGQYFKVLLVDGPPYLGFRLLDRSSIIPCLVSIFLSRRIEHGGIVVQLRLILLPLLRCLLDG